MDLPTAERVTESAEGQAGSAPGAVCSCGPCRSVHEMLTPARQAEGLAELAGRDPVLRALLAQFGAPPLWSRPPGFAALVLIILEQQVSLASARAAFTRLQARVGEVTPEVILASADNLRGAGLTRQKSAYLLALAEAVVNGRVDLDGLERQDDAGVREALSGIKGVGPWTVDVYLLLALLRPDILPVGDLALVSSVRRVYGLAERPTRAQLLVMGQSWRPWRSVATRLLWHAYLQERGRSFQG
ncbi:DNA-3-methyladenine glycosylase family protein [Deinococcus peraridilitoris]|uniref:DNA-3-methyladenine glycosylase II n=1 Tax=Deinococcus peraridilitoris (strain DSM 19664 / LMG 22246 / CIP 109416 / KR-200) TaxID=937777 RepID=K9ZYY9_DEIPD|nr:DNA-3-methyladenine glycosylase [Deinococcus peraridilitoris]AFZ66868.1 3-methyladenine DNA glycosylase/8-oxoguanine DNA glycosylase [Deinococcus peraridilitoris DSM 19664]